MIKLPKKVVLMNGLWHHGDFFYKGLSYYLAQDSISITQWHLLANNNAGLQQQVQYLRNHLLTISLNEVTLVAHSVSCTVILEYLRRYGRQGIKEVFLITPLPRQGGFIPSLKTAKAFPKIFFQAFWKKNLGLFATDASAVRKLFFEASISEQMLVQYQKQLGNASFLLFLDVLFPNILPKKNQLPPLHIIAAHDDFFMTKKQTLHLGECLGIPREKIMLFPGPHDILIGDNYLYALGYLVDQIIGVKVEIKKEKLRLVTM